ncbi:MAG: hypothetical protein RIR62_856 [Pseudomonadota bacterium]|jgi:two-component system sensor histidine kinase/response regulator
MPWRALAAGLLSGLPLAGAAVAQTGTSAPAEVYRGVLSLANVVESLVVAVVAMMALTVVFRTRMLRAQRARDATETALRERIRCHDSLHAAFVATEDMDRPMAQILRELADAIRLGTRQPALARIRISLFGTVHDEIGASLPAIRTTRDIPHAEGGADSITVAYDAAPDDGPAFPQAEEVNLSLIASRVGERALGHRTLREIRDNEVKFREVFSQQAVATLVMADRRFVAANGAAAAMLGYPDPSALVGKTPLDISPRYQPDGRSSHEAALALLERMEALRTYRFEWEHLSADGQAVLVDIHASTVQDAQGRTISYLMWNDITVRRRAEQALAAYQRTLEAQVALRTEELSRLYDEVRAILATASSGIALLRDGRIVNGNPALARMLMVSESDLAGAPGERMFRGQAEWENVLAQTETALACHGHCMLEQEFIRSDGSNFWGRLRVAPVDAGDPARGAVWVLDDVTHDRTARHELAQAREIAEQAVQLKSDFLAQMSHEIRSPINAVLGFAELLLNTPLTGLQLDYLRKVQASGRHLLMIINDILDLSKVEAGKLRIEMTEFDLDPVLAAAVDTVARVAADRDVELLVDVDPDLPARFMGDPLRLTQILINLLSNAAKFTPKGEIRLTVRPADLPPDRTGLRFSVSDTGIGMAAEQVARLFQRFSQAEASTARHYGGTGLGLSICKHLALLMEGDLGVSSVEGAGSDFWLVLPLAPASPPRSPLRPAALAGRIALVVDDNAAARALITRHLQRAGMEVEQAASAAAAVEAMEAAAEAGREVAVALVDRKMPGLSGVDCARRIRALPLPHPPRIVLMTKRGGQDVVDLVAAEGLDDLVTKPVAPDALVARVAAVLTAPPKQPPAPPAASRKARAAPDAPLPAPAGGWSGRKALVVDDNPINRELSGAILVKNGFAVEGATNGAEALEAVLQQDFDVILLDGNMPVMDGLETARRIRALPTGKGRVPIIGLTGRTEDGDREAGLLAGMNDYLVKPVAPSALREVLEQWVPRAPHGGGTGAGRKRAH